MSDRREMATFPCLLASGFEDAFLESRSVGRAINSYYRLINAGFILLLFSESHLSSGSGSDDNNPEPREG